MRWVAAAAVVLGVATAAPAAPAGDGDAGGVDVRTITLTARHSRFEAGQLEAGHLDVPLGARVRFVVRNLDPIDHELILGDAGIHQRHERGTEPYHPPRPGEVTVPGGSEAATTYVFTEPGTVEFGCHLPGHWAYGMRGTVRVSPRT